MKTKLLLLAALFLGFVLQSCNDDDNNGTANNTAVENEFATRYPGASRIDWEVKGNYYVADFWLNNQESEAWFSWDGNWYYTETDILFEQLPEAIKTAFGQSEYTTWHIDDVDVLDRKDMEVIYVVEVEQGNQEYDLYYSVDGMLIKAIHDSNNSNNGNYLPTSLPESVSRYISTTYPNAKTLEIEAENGYYEVDILDGGKHLELLFSSAGDWVYTKTEDLLQSNVLQNVLAALQNSEYGTYRIDDIDYYETSTGNYYLFELESGSTEVNVKVTLDGAIERVVR